MSDTPRLIAGRYELGGLIGRGGMADVYEGTDTRLGRTVAIKLLKSDLANDPTFEARFRQEAQASARMAHPTIVRVYDAGEDVTFDQQGQEHKRPFIIMEYVRGRLLRDLLHERPFSIEESLEYTAGVLTALEFSHRAGVIHRDIKSANVMITDQGQVKVMDFGIARAVSDSSATMAQTSGIMGTAQYFSPEQAKGESVDSRTDLYSTGVLLYEMLAGRPPFKGDTAVSVAYQHVSEAVIPPSQFNAQISRELDAVVLRALAKDRVERFQTAEEFREHLLAAAMGTPITQPTAVLEPGEPDAVETAEPVESAEVVEPAAEETALDGEQVAEAASVGSGEDTDEEAAKPEALDPFDALLAGEVTATAAVQIAGDAPIVEPAGSPAVAPAAPATPSTAAPATPTPPATTAKADDDFEADLANAGFDRTSVLPAAQIPVKVPEFVTPAETKRDSLIENPFAELGVELPTEPASANASATGKKGGLLKGERPSPGLIWGASTAAGVVVIGLLIWLISFGGSLNFTVTGNSGIAVPDVTNQNYTVGIQSLEGAKLLVTKNYEPSDTVPAESIIRTDPVAGTLVPPNTTITVVISTGKATIQMPNLLGMDEAAATAAIASAKLTLGTISQVNSATAPLGQVISSDPMAGTAVSAGTIVNLSISNGKVMVPDVRNLDISDAQSRMMAPEVGFTVSIQTKTDCTTGTKGTIVLDQSILPGAAPQASTVILYVECKTN